MKHSSVILMEWKINDVLSKCENADVSPICIEEGTI